MFRETALSARYKNVWVSSSVLVIHIYFSEDTTSTERVVVAGVVVISEIT